MLRGRLLPTPKTLFEAQNACRVQQMPPCFCGLPRVAKRRAIRTLLHPQLGEKTGNFVKSLLLGGKACSALRKELGSPGFWGACRKERALVQGGGLEGWLWPFRATRAPAPLASQLQRAEPGIWARLLPCLVRGRGWRPCGGVGKTSSHPDRCSPTRVSEGTWTH